MLKETNLDGIKSWLAPTIGIRLPSSLEEGAIIEKKEMNVMAQFWFRFISSNLMPSQNELILQHSKIALVECIMDRRKLNLGSIIASKILTRAKQLQNSPPFPGLITELCRCVGVQFHKKIDLEITSSTSIDIWRIEAEFQRDEEDKARKKPVNTTPLVYVETLEFATRGRYIFFLSLNNYLFYSIPF